MPFQFTPKLKKPSEYGGSPERALMDEVGQYTKAHRQYGMRSMLGLEKDEPEQPSMGSTEMETSPEECEACKMGTCDDPAHASEEDTEAMGGLVISITPKG